MKDRTEIRGYLSFAAMGKGCYASTRAPSARGIDAPDQLLDDGIWRKRRKGR
jgi:hypothetical protein